MAEVTLDIYARQLSVVDIEIVELNPILVCRALPCLLHAARLIYSQWRLTQEVREYLIDLASLL
jgi:hypothetical protein